MFQLLETFIAVYETNSFTKAANALYISQPTISVHIEKLEKELDVKLFERNARNRIEKTEAATLFYEKAKQILNGWESGKEELAALSGKARRKYTIAASQTIGGYLLPQIMNALGQLYPQINFEILLDNSTNVYKAVHMFEADLGLVETPEVYPDMNRTIFMKDQLVILGDRELERWILREEGSGIRQYTEMYLKEQQILPEEKIIASSNALILELVKQGMGRTLQSARVAEKLSLPVQKTDLIRPLYLILPKEDSGKNVELAQSIFDLLKKLGDV
ncbi:LysR family transcriptional regulator [Listeria aquatica]|uniref:LysR family transcriptional regulator n=1 Tax=Listeria aquatica TaxID=1494960 RepID=A0A841ZKX6_9LIST|nr:LysR family transcriptional regulator [Listeria aquatica]MBC1520182.1 LysR family transcriptional regulator [Listeria aquatica]